MADHHHYRQTEHRRQAAQQQGLMGYLNVKGPTAQQTISTAILLPLSGGLMALAGITFAATVVGLAIATPLFVIFSPVIVPAAFVVGLVMLGFLAAGAFGLTAIASIWWMFRRYWDSGHHGSWSLGSQIDWARRGMEEAGEYVGRRTKDLGQGIQNIAHDHGASRAHD